MSSMSDKKLPFSGNAILLEKIMSDYNKLVDANAVEIPKTRIYKIACENESPKIERSARKSALNSFQEGFVKVAIDSRRIDQETERNPRFNIQYFSRSQPFIDKKDQENIDVFVKLMEPLMEIKAVYGREPEYLNSYARILYDHVERALRLKQGDKELFKPQISYLEQLIYARYRLSMDDIKKFGKDIIKERVLEKDEDLLKRGAYLEATGGLPEVQKQEVKKQATVPAVVRTGDLNTQESIINAIFGAGDIRKPGDKKSSRTITITLSDSSE